MKDNNNSLAVPNLHIPPEAVEAVAKMLCRERHPCWSIVAEIFETDHDGQATEFRSLATAAIRAALENWPGMGRFEDETGWDVHIELPLLIPLPTEPRDERD